MLSKRTAAAIAPIRTVLVDGEQALSRRSHDQLEQHLAEFVSAYNFGRRLESLKGFAPYEFIGKCCTSEPKQFTLKPIRQMPGLNTEADPVVLTGVALIVQDFARSRLRRKYAGSRPPVLAGARGTWQAADPR